MSNRKCTRKACRSELPSKANSDGWQAGGFCNVTCKALHGLALVAVKKERKRKADELGIKKRNSDLKKKVKANPRALALKTAQMLARISGADGDGNCVCVTCGHTGPWNDGFDGGHFIAKGSCSFWMLDPRNIHPQCKGCNGFNMKHGSAPIKYTRWMTLMYGSELVDHMLANTNTIIKRTAKDYEQFISEANAEILIHKKRIGC